MFKHVLSFLVVALVVSAVPAHAALNPEQLQVELSGLSANGPNAWEGSAGSVVNLSMRFMPGGQLTVVAKSLVDGDVRFLLQEPVGAGKATNLSFRIPPRFRGAGFELRIFARDAQGAMLRHPGQVIEVRR